MQTNILNKFKSNTQIIINDNIYFVKKSISCKSSDLKTYQCFQDEYGNIYIYNFCHSILRKIYDIDESKHTIIKFVTAINVVFLLDEKSNVFAYCFRSQRGDYHFIYPEHTLIKIYDDAVDIFANQYIKSVAILNSNYNIVFDGINTENKFTHIITNLHNMKPVEKISFMHNIVLFLDIDGDLYFGTSNPNPKFQNIKLIDSNVNRFICVDVNNIIYFGKPHKYKYLCCNESVTEILVYGGQVEPNTYSHTIYYYKSDIGIYTFKKTDDVQKLSDDIDIYTLPTIIKHQPQIKSANNII